MIGSGTVNRICLCATTCAPQLEYDGSLHFRYEFTEFGNLTPPGRIDIPVKAVMHRRMPEMPWINLAL